MKKCFLLFALLPLMVILFSCKGNDARTEVRQMVKELNDQCPIHYDYITCQSAEIQGDEMVMNYIIDESMLSMKLMQEQPEIAKKYGGSSLFNVNDELGDLLMKSGLGLTANYQGSLSGDIVTLKFTNQEIKEIKAHPISNDELLDWEVMASNSILPKKLDDVTTLISLTRDGDVVAYTYEVDEDKLDMAVVNDGQSELKQTLSAQIATLNSPTSTAQTFMRLLRRGNKDLHYVYKGNLTGKTVRIEFTNDELRELAGGYAGE